MRRSPTKKAVAKKAVTKKAVTKKAVAKRALSTTPTLDNLPVTWWIRTGAQTVGLWVDVHVWTGNDRGEILCLDRDTGALVRDAKLPDQCVAVVADGPWIYAGCGDGNVYDLTGRVPRAVYELGGERVDWLEVYQGVLCVSDDAGTVTVIDVDGSVRWRKRDKKAAEGWVLRTAPDGLYHGSEVGLRKYDWSGKRLWKVNPGDVRYGHLEGDAMLVTAGCSTKAGRTEAVLLDRATGAARWARTPQPGARLMVSRGAEGCGGGRTAAGELRLYAAVGPWVFCYDERGALLWQSRTSCAELCNLHVVGERLYFASSSGVIGCADVSEGAIAAALRGEGDLPDARRQPRVAARSTALETTCEQGAGVLIECVRDGSKLRMHVASPGYHHEWFCQFPRDIRQAGVRYVVDAVREATQGGYYRVLGDVRRVEDPSGS